MLTILSGYKRLQRNKKMKNSSNRTINFPANNSKWSDLRKNMPIFATIMIIVLLCEAIVMTILHLLNFRGTWIIAMDPTLLAILSTPLLYWFVVKPIDIALEQRKKAEKALRKAKENADLTNQELEKAIDRANRMAVVAEAAKRMP